MLKHRFSCTERTGDKARTTFHNRVYGVDYTHTGFQQFERTRFFLIVGHGALHGPFLYHVHPDVITFAIRQHCNGILNAVITFLCNGFHGAHTFLFKRHHDFQRLEVFVHLSQPGSGFHLVAHLCQRHKMPFASFIQRIGILPAFQENTVHLIEVVLQTVVVLRKHTGPQCHFEHMSGKLSFGPHFQSAGTLKYLHVDLGTYYLNHLRHQLVSSGRDITNLILRYRSVDDEGHHVGYYATNSSFCCHIFLVVYFI